MLRVALAPARSNGHVDDASTARVTRSCRAHAHAHAYLPPLDTPVTANRSSPSAAAKPRTSCGYSLWKNGGTATGPPRAGPGAMSRTPDLSCPPGRRDAHLQTRTRGPVQVQHRGAQPRSPALTYPTSVPSASPDAKISSHHHPPSFRHPSAAPAMPIGLQAGSDMSARVHRETRFDLSSPHPLSAWSCHVALLVPKRGKLATALVRGTGRGTAGRGIPVPSAL